eukprot:scaffold10235_cov112-Isochrysis_galbana.AAC.2
MKREYHTWHKSCSFSASAARTAMVPPSAPVRSTTAFTNGVACTSAPRRSARSSTEKEKSSKPGRSSEADDGTRDSPGRCESGLGGGASARSTHTADPTHIGSSSSSSAALRRLRHSTPVEASTPPDAILGRPALLASCP